MNWEARDRFEVDSGPPPSLSMPDLAVLGTGRACAGPVHGGLHLPSVPLHFEDLGHMAGRSSGAKGMRSWQNINSKAAAKTSGWSPAAAATPPTTMSPVRPPGIFCAPTGRMPGSSGSIPRRRASSQGVLDIVTGDDIVATGWKSRAGDVFLQGRRRQFAAHPVSRRTGA